MRYALSVAAFGIGASALSVPRSCTFSLTASGGISGTVGTLSDGQNRIGGDHEVEQYTINNGAVIDSFGNGCILTPEVMQWQCDANFPALAGFNIGSTGSFTFNGDSVFYACPATDDEYNIYTIPVAGQKKCVQISLMASGCYNTTATGESSSSTAPVSSAPAASDLVTESPAGSAPAASAPPSSALATSAPAASVPAGSAAAPSAPAASVPAGSAAAPSAPAASVPAGSAAAPSAPAASVPAGSASAPSAPAASVPAGSASAPSAPAASVPAASSTPAASVPAASVPAASSTPSTSAGTCPTTLLGTSTGGLYQYPHLIVPVSSSSPDQAVGTQYNATISSTESTIFNFDIPTSYAGKQCSLLFLFPEQDQLETSAFTFSGTGAFDFAQLSTVATEQTTYNTVGDIANDFGVMTATPGSTTVVSTFSCPAGERVSYEISTTDSTSLIYFQDWNPSPIGLYVVEC